MIMDFNRVGEMVLSSWLICMVRFFSLCALSAVLLYSFSLKEKKTIKIQEEDDVKTHRSVLYQNSLKRAVCNIYMS